MTKVIKSVEEFSEIMKQFKYKYVYAETNRWLTFIIYNLKYCMWNDETKELTIETQEDSRTIPMEAKHRLLNIVLDDGTIRCQVMFKNT